jgi:hypothetical protein
LNKLQEEFLSISELRLIAVEAFKHFEFVDLRQDFQQASQFLSADVVVPAVFD